MSTEKIKNRVSRREIAKVVNERLNKPLTNAQMVEVIDTMFDVISDIVISGSQAAIPGFGKFGKRHYKGRMGRNPRTGEAVPMEDFSAPYFRPSALFRRAVR